MSGLKLQVGEQAFDLRLDFFLCPTHGLFVPSRFDPDWTTDEGCPVRVTSAECCGEALVPVYLDHLTAAQGPEHPRCEGCDKVVGTDRGPYPPDGVYLCEECEAPPKVSVPLREPTPEHLGGEEGGE